MKNVFTIDTEDWYHANFEDDLFCNDSSVISTVEDNIDKYLAFFSDNNVKATFFVLGFVVEQHPEMVKRIAREGHEIASHGYGHQLVYKQTQQTFKEDVYKSKVLLEDCVGEKVIGYRAPSWSITEKSLWGLEILEELGFKYSSSIFPTKNYLYGIPYAPRFIHDSTIYGKDGLSIVNVPPSTIKIGKINVPFSGGAYFRLLPYSLIKTFTDHVNRTEDQAVIFYLHPREIDPEQPRLKLKARDYMIHYVGIRGCEKKLVNILKQYDFVTMRELLVLDS